jgi:hypothetical protein
MRGAFMNDILDDLNSWQALLVVERRYRQQVGEEPGADLTSLGVPSTTLVYAGSEGRKFLKPKGVGK